MASRAHSTPVPAQQPELRPFIVYDHVPAGCGTHLVGDHDTAPLIRAGETLVLDPADKMPATGELFVIEYGRGSPRGPQRYLVQFRCRRLCVGDPRVVDADGNTIMAERETWWASAYCAPRTLAEVDEVIAAGRMLRCSDGPYVLDDDGRCDYLAERLIGRVVGIYQASYAEPLRLAA